MDCNNYSYAPHMLDDITTISEYRNDDMYIMHTRKDNTSIISAYSYDGRLDTYDEFTSPTIAAELYAHIILNYSTTASDNRKLNAYIRRLHRQDRRA